MREGMMRDKLQQLHFDISQHLNEIAALFKDEVGLKITLIVRTPELADGGVLISNDDPDAAIAEIIRLRAKEPLRL
jgi:hypothetical protein